MEEHPKSVSFLMNQGIYCMACGEPVWGTLEDRAIEKGLESSAIDKIVKELNEYIRKE